MGFEVEVFEVVTRPRRVVCSMNQNMHLIDTPAQQFGTRSTCISSVGKVT
jgi:hypothetical protein